MVSIFQTGVLAFYDNGLRGSQAWDGRMSTVISPICRAEALSVSEDGSLSTRGKGLVKRMRGYGIGRIICRV